MGNHAATAGRSLQLCRWVCELGGRMVCRQERMVLQGAWQGLCQSAGRMRHGCDYICTIRLRSWICQLDGWMVDRQEGMVLHECWQRLPPEGRGLRLIRSGRNAERTNPWRWR